MKVTQEEVETVFIPVTITLESQAEVNAMWQVTQHFGGRPVLGARRMIDSLSAHLSAKVKFKASGDPIWNKNRSIHFTEDSDQILGFTV